MVLNLNGTITMLITSFCYPIKSNGIYGSVHDHDHLDNGYGRDITIGGDVKWA